MKPELSIYQWFEASHIDYADLYMKLYVAYNAWYRQVTGAMNDREAIRQLKNRFVIWRGYLEGSVLEELRPFHEMIVEVTSEMPLASSSSWSGTVKDTKDWQGLISFWYRVRCELFHGSLSEFSSTHRVYIRLAYRSLSIFMEEIVYRMRQSFSDQDEQRLQELELLSRVTDEQESSKHEKYRLERERLYAKYISAPSLWAVDLTEK